VRFTGAQGYVVTFRQIDPLYTLDLSAPAAPKVAGELELPGYSAYLHPISETLLLGIGQEASDQGRPLGTQVSLFDVSDLAHPRRIQHAVYGNGSSDAEFDHHAFLWWAPTGTAVLPLQTYDPSGDPAKGFTGAIGLHVAPQAIAEVGRVVHGSGPDVAPIARSLVVGDRLYTLSYLGLQASRLDTLAPVAFVAFTP
jgi:Beta propeller domain